MGRPKKKMNDAPNVLIIPRQLKNGLTSYYLKYRDSDGNWLKESCKDEHGHILHTVDKSTPYAAEINREVKKQLKAIQANMMMLQTTASERRPQIFKKIPISDLLQIYLDYKLSIGYKAINCVKHLQKLLLAFDGAAAVSSIDENFVLRFQNWMMKEQAFSNNTIYVNMLQFSALLNWANGKYISFSKSPISALKGKRIKQEDKHLVFLTAEELKAIETAYNEKGQHGKYKDLYRIFLAGCFCGLRCSDLQRLKWSNIKNTGPQSYCEITMQKTSQPLRIPLNKKSLYYFGDRGTADSQVFAPTYAVELQRFIKGELRPIVDGKQITFHTSRHTFAVLMLQRGVSIYAIKELLGHTDIKTTIKYLALLDEDKQKAVTILDNL